LSDYPGEEDGAEDSDEMDGDLGETGQLSPTETSPERNDNIEHFMQEVQPGNLVES
jgi:hypothetical protein